MMKLQILGPGCARCVKLYENTDAAAKALGLDYEITKVSEVKDIVAFGVMSTPALAVDGVVKSAGRLLTVDEIKKLLSQ
jgi:small redox-active disulfide protein 2